MRFKMAVLYARFLMWRRYEMFTACYRAGMTFGVSGSEIWSQHRELWESLSAIGLWTMDPVAREVILRGCGLEVKDPIAIDLGHLEAGSEIRLDMDEPNDSF